VAAPIEDEERKGKYPNKKRDGREIGQIDFKKRKITTIHKTTTR
jgi:hypothetical protein